MKGSNLLNHLDDGAITISTPPRLHPEMMRPSNSPSIPSLVQPLGWLGSLRSFLPWSCLVWSRCCETTQYTSPDHAHITVNSPSYPEVSTTGPGITIRAILVMPRVVTIRITAEDTCALGLLKMHTERLLMKRAYFHQRSCSIQRC